MRTKQEAESGRDKDTFHDSRDAGEHDPTIAEGCFQSRRMRPREKEKKVPL